MKVLFLDIDGVLNSHQSIHMYFRKSGGQGVRCDEHHFCPIAVSNLLTLFEEIPDLKIVVSSTWRRFSSREELEEMFRMHGVDPAAFIGITPYHPGAHRGLEIQDWLDIAKQNGMNIEKFAIVDDDSDMAHFRESGDFFKTDGRMGLMYDVTRRIIDHLNPTK